MSISPDSNRSLKPHHHSARLLANRSLSVAAIPERISSAGSPNSFSRSYTPAPSPSASTFILVALVSFLLLTHSPVVSMVSPIALIKYSLATEPRLITQTLSSCPYLATSTPSSIGSPGSNSLFTAASIQLNGISVSSPCSGNCPNTFAWYSGESLPHL